MASFQTAPPPHKADTRRAIARKCFNPTSLSPPNDRPVQEILIAHSPKYLLSIALRSVVHERPQTVLGPAECSLGLVGQNL